MLNSPIAHRNPVPGTVNIQVGNDLTSAAAATISRAGDGRGHTPDLQRSRARQLYLARELVVLDAAESSVEE